MKYVTPSILLAALLVAEGHSAAEPASFAPRASLAAVMPSAGQALLFDRIRGEYVVVRTGDDFHGFRVTAIEADQIVLARPDEGGRHYVLPAVSELRPVGERTVRCGGEPSAPSVQPVPSSGLEPLDPYAPDSASIIDPYADTEDITTVLAPPGQRAAKTEPAHPSPDSPRDPGAEPGARSRAPGQTPAGRKAEDAAARTRVAQVPPTVVQTHGEPIRREESYSIRRREFDAALADFHALSKEVQIEIHAGQVRVVGLSAGSYFHRLGLRQGDVVARVAGQPVGDLNAAASVYARLMSSDRFTVEVSRGNQRVTLKYRFVD